MTPTDPHTAALSFQQGEVAMIEEVYRNRRMFYFNLAFNVCGDNQMAEDIVGDCFLKLLEHVRDFADRDHLERTLNIMVRGHWSNLFWKDKRRQQLLSELEMATVEMPDPDQASTKEYLENRVGLLPEYNANIIRAYFFQEMSVKEISSLYNLTKKQVQNIKDKSLQLLRNNKMLLKFLSDKSKQDRVDKWIELFKSGLSFDDISKQFPGYLPSDIKQAVTRKMQRRLTAG